MAVLGGQGVSGTERKFKRPTKATVVHSVGFCDPLRTMGEVQQRRLDSSIRKLALLEDILLPTESAVINILALLARDVNISEVVGAFERDPALQYNLLKVLRLRNISNHVKGGVHSLGQAIALIGYKGLRQWLTSLLLCSTVETITPSCYITAAARGRQMQLLAKLCGIPRFERDTVFLIGSLSAIERMIGVPMKAVLSSIDLAPSVQGALIAGEGPYALLLQIIQASEAGKEGVLRRLVDRLGISWVDAKLAVAQGMQFATEIH